jgi:hypothetical protein
MNIEDVKSKYEKQLMRLPNVTGVGIGEKAGTKVIKVFVTRKVPEATLQPEDILPRILEGWEIDVEEIGIVRAEE